MDIDQGISNHFGVDPTGLKPEKNPGISALSNQQFPLQGLSYSESKNLFDVTESFGLKTNLHPITFVEPDLSQLIQSSIYLQKKIQDIYDKPDWLENSNLLPVSVVQGEYIEATKAVEKQDNIPINNLIQQSSSYDTIQMPLERIDHDLDRKVSITNASESDISIQIIDGQRLVIENDSLSIQELMDDFYHSRTNLAEELKEPTTKAYRLNDIWQQDYQGGIIIYSNTYGLHSVKGSIFSFYQSQDGVLGMPLIEEVMTGYGRRQDFQEGTIIHSVRYGSQLVNGIVGNYYRNLSGVQRSKLGAPYTSGHNLDNGNWQQFFQGGILECQSNGVGIIKFTPSLTCIDVISQSASHKFQQYQIQFSNVE
jgi:LGFP repeat